MKNLIELITDATLTGKPFALCTVVNACGSTPQSEGSRMIVFLDGKISGTVGGGCVEGTVIKTALKLLTNCAVISPAVDFKKTDIITINLTDPLARPDGDICGGSMTILIEALL